MKLLPRQAFSLIACAVFMAGAQSLALEMILLKLATRYTGSASESTTLVLTLFLLGLTAGAALVFKLNQQKNYLLSYLPVFMPLLMAAGTAMVAKLSLTSTTDIAQTGGAYPANICALAMAVLATIAGTILPAAIVLSGRVDTNRPSILLYLLSNLGSAGGCFLAAFRLMPAAGLAGSLYCLALGYILVAVLFAPLVIPLIKVTGQAIKPSAHNGHNENDDKDENDAKDKNQCDFVSLEDAVASVLRPIDLIAVGGAALASLLFECLAIRLFNLICGASYITTVCVMAASLLGITLGARLALFLPGGKNSRVILALTLVLASAALALSVLSLPLMSTIFQLLRHWLNVSSGQAVTEPARFLSYFYPRLVLTLIFCLPPTAALALTFPAASLGASRREDVLKFYLASGLATALAPGLFYFYLDAFYKVTDKFNQAGSAGSAMEMMLRLLAGALAIMAAFILRGQSPRKKSMQLGKFAGLVLLGSTGGILLLARPLNPASLNYGLSFVDPNLSMKQIVADDRHHRRLFYRESLDTTVEVHHDPVSNLNILQTDGKIEGSIPADLAMPSPHSDLSTQVSLALIPLMTKNTAIRNCFIVGYGTGTTTAAVKRLTGLNAVVAEIDPAVLEAGACFGHELKDTGTTGDARKILSAANSRYDLIVSQPGEPWVQGSTNLYSLEFYSLVKSRLAPTGRFCQWMPLYGLRPDIFARAVNTFHRAFPGLVVFHQPGAGEVLLIGSNDAISPSLSKVVEENFARPEYRGLLLEIGLKDPATILDNLLRPGAGSPSQGQGGLDERASDTGSLVLDDNQLLEFQSVSGIENAGDYIAGNLAYLHKSCGPATLDER